jgi:hypothetical protein
MGLRSYVLATYAGMLPVSYAFAFAGSGLDAVFASHQEAYQQCLAAGRTNCAVGLSAKSLLTPELMIALGALGALALAPIAVRYWQTRAQP